MLKYTIKRVLMLIPTIIGITLFIYLIMSFVPGDPAELLSPPEATAEEVEVLRAELGLDKPVLVQYVNYMWDILHGDFGVSWFTKQPVIDEIVNRMPYTLSLGVLSTLIASIISIPLGTLTAVKHNTPADYIVTFLCLLFAAMPASGSLSSCKFILACRPAGSRRTAWEQCGTLSCPLLQCVRQAWPPTSVPLAPGCSTSSVRTTSEQRAQRAQAKSLLS